MQLITEAQVASVLDADTARLALREAFLQHGRGRAQVLARHRATASQDGASLAISAMGAILDADGDLPAVLGTKVYSSRNGRYHFLVSLFSAATGEALATLEANEFTRLRTAAATAVATDLLALPDAKTLAVFGAGIQARAHAEALVRVRRFERVLVCARSGAEALAAELGELLAAPRPRGPQDIAVYKSVGIGLEDVALARVVARRLGVL